ncbi:hypothetical protein AB0G00_06470 [Nocardia salmonicida]|uniref:DUF7373 family lipoprotein n=1 Tax=Nocardia salmonicida TaxID=53431 RepID=UPI0033C68274
MASASCGAPIEGVPTPVEMPVDLTKLSLGSYSPEPHRYELSVVAKAKDVRDVESKRMLNYVILSTEIDPETDELAAVETYTDPGGPFTTPALPETLRPTLTDNSLLAGAYVARTDGDLRSPRRLIVSLLRFPTADQAGRASADITQALRKENAQSIPVAGAGMTEVTAFSTDWSAGTAVFSQELYTVIINYGRAESDQGAITSHLTKAVDLQLSKLRQLHPTQWEDVLDTPLDPDGIMRRALASELPNYPFTVEKDFAAFHRDGHIHYERNVVLMMQAYADSGTDLIGRRFGITYRTRDLSGAFRLQSALTTLDKGDENIPSPPYLADARCIKLYEADRIRKIDLMCVVVRGRYVGAVFARSKLYGQVDPVLYERAAAQYTLLAKSE